jgi:hypothetical protein
MQTMGHAQRELGKGFEEALIIAFVVELFGYASLYKALQFAEYNRKYTDAKRKAPFMFAIGIWAFYLVIVIFFNVIPETASGKPSHVIWMNILIALLSVPGGALTGVSAIHTERKEASKRKRTNSEPNEEPNEQQPTEQRTNARANERTQRTNRTNAPLPLPTNEHRTNKRPFGFSPLSEQRTNDDKQARLFQHIEQLQANGQPVPGPSELSRQLEMSKSYISERLKQWRG